MFKYSSKTKCMGISMPIWRPHLAVEGFGNVQRRLLDVAHQQLRGVVVCLNGLGPVRSVLVSVCTRALTQNNRGDFRSRPPSPEVRPVQTRSSSVGSTAHCCRVSFGFRASGSSSKHGSFLPQQQQQRLRAGAGGGRHGGLHKHSPGDNKLVTVSCWY